MTIPDALTMLDGACRARRRVVVRIAPPLPLPEPGPGGRDWEPSVRELVSLAGGSRFHNLRIYAVDGRDELLDATRICLLASNPYWADLALVAKIWEFTYEVAVVHAGGLNNGIAVWVDGYLGRVTPIASSLAAFLHLYARFVERTRTSSDAAFPFGSAKLIAEDKPFVARIRAGALPEWEPDEEADALFQQVLREADRRAR